MAIKQLVSFNRALSHLRVEAGEDDDAIKDLIDAASDIVVDYLKLKEIPDTWALEDCDTASTVPGAVRSAVLLVLGTLYDDREGTTSPLTPAVESLLMRLRDPAVARSQGRHTRIRDIDRQVAISSGPSVSSDLRTRVEEIIIEVACHSGCRAKPTARM
ncbi:head-tail connector protein [Burkholderia cepacia]|uniref:head-tail connector protein n=2 Tax=Burkholderia cepacia TaxID=292 RepID=UPI001CF1A268|nr:head-tail connector protein [Burkholderia cepacia]MCA7979037.1 head-tail connector protein [Burkholderia cepacia]